MDEPKAIEFCKKKFPGGHFRVGNALRSPIFIDTFWETNFDFGSRV